MIPSRKEMMNYWFEHPIAGTFIVFGMAEGIKTIWESLVNPKGQSPFSTYTDVRSTDILDQLGTATADELQHHHDKFHYENHKKYLSASHAHADGQVIYDPGDFDKAHQHEQGDFTHTHSGLGSSSTTTSTSSAHGGTQRTNAGSTWDNQRMPGEVPQMFGGKKKGSVLMGPPSMRRRISLNSITLGGLSKAPQELTQGEVMPTTEHFGMINMMPEQSDDATDNPWV